MKLAIDNINTLEIEKAQVSDIEEGRKNLPPVVDWKDKVHRTYDYWVGMGFITPDYRIDWDNSDITSYKSIFRKAIDGMRGMYIDDIKTLIVISQTDLPVETKAQIYRELKNMSDMFQFAGYMKEHLSERWTTDLPSPKFEIARSILEQISLWGIDEARILSTINEAGPSPR